MAMRRYIARRRAAREAEETSAQGCRACAGGAAQPLEAAVAIARVGTLASGRRAPPTVEAG
eukprot:13479074-Alexandrium_andersonii.AAC.1